MLALVPFLALVLTLAVKLLPDPTESQRGVGVGNQAVDRLQATLQSLFPPEAYKVVTQEITDIKKRPPVGLLSVGLVITIWLASSLFVAIIDATDRIYGVIETRPWWEIDLVAIAMTVVQAIILLGSLILIVEQLN